VCLTDLSISIRYYSFKLNASLSTTVALCNMTVDKKLFLGLCMIIMSTQMKSAVDGQ
jgi:hypothetical protein